MEEKELYKRVKIYRASREYIMDTVRALESRVNILQREELPDGYIVLDVQYNYQCGCFDFIVAHESFPRVAEAGEIQFFDEDGMRTVRTYEMIPI